MTPALPLFLPSSTDPVRRPTVALGVAALALWMVPAAVALGQIYIEQTLAGQPVAWRLALWTTLPNWVLWALLTPPVAMLAQRWAPGRAPAWQIAAVHLAGGALALGAHAVGNVAAFRFAGLPAAWTVADLSTHYALRAHVNAVAYALVVASTWTWAMHRRQREREAREGLLRTALAEAELQALRMQLRPHFLFNALHAVGATVRKGEADRAVTMLSRLADLLRLSLETDGADEVTLRRELDVAERYLDLEAIRFQDRLTVAFDVEAGVQRARVPTWILQPLVENAVKHAVAPRTGPARLRIEARRLGDRLRLSVVDDGPGPGAAAAAHSTGVGLANTAARLAALYGDEATLDLRPGPGGVGAEARVDLPYRET
jgi:signal transduction histidine kinase